LSDETTAPAIIPVMELMKRCILSVLC